MPVETTKVFGCSIKWADKRESAKRSLEAWAKEEVALKLIDEKGIRALVKNDSKKLRLINVWATWCGPCVAELPEFVTMNRMYRNRDFELVTISADSPEEKDKALDVLKKKQVSASNYLFEGDDKYKLIDAVDEKASGPVPHTILVAPAGRCSTGYRGRVNRWRSSGPSWTTSGILQMTGLCLPRSRGRSRYERAMGLTSISPPSRPRRAV